MTKIKYAGDVQATSGSLIGATAIIGTDPTGSELLRVGGSLRASGAVITGTIKPKGLASALVPTFDVASDTLVIANAASATVTGMAYGMVLIASGNTGNAALVGLAGGSGTIIWQSSTTFSGVAATGSKCNVYALGGNLVIQNNTGSSDNFTASLTKLG